MKVVVVVLDKYEGLNPAMTKQDETLVALAVVAMAEVILGLEMT